MSPLPRTSSYVAPGAALATANLDSQFGFAWESPSLAHSSSHLIAFIAQAGWPWAKHRWGLTLPCTTQETPEPADPVESYRPHQSTTTLPSHSWSSTEGRGCCSIVTVSPCSWLAWVNPSHWPANSNQGSTTRGGCTQPTQRVHLEYPGWVIGEAVPLDPSGHHLH